MAEGLAGEAAQGATKKEFIKETKMIDQTQKSGIGPIGTFNSECYKNRKGRIKSLPESTAPNP